MVYGDLQFFDIIVFAAIAVFLIYRLRGVLGKRTGYEKGPTTNQYTSKKEEEPTISPITDSWDTAEPPEKGIPKPNWDKLPIDNWFDCLSDK